MLSLERQKPKTVFPLVRVGRTFAGLVTARFFPAEVISQEPNDGLSANNGLSELEKVALAGCGNLILGPHFSLGEFPRASRIIMTNPVLGDREMVSALGIHQFKLYYRLVAFITGLTACPIVNEDTYRYIEKHPEKAAKYQEALTRDGAANLLREYLAVQAPRTLGRGGTVFLYPQGGMRSSLESVTEATSTLIRRTTRNNTDNYAITIMGTRIKGIENYDESIRGLNKGLVYEFIVRRTRMKEAFLKEAKDRGISIDQLVLEELRAVADENYLPKKPAIAP